MTIYNKYVIHQGDTLQKIANFELGDMSLWSDIRDLNNLEYPYIVGTADEKQENYNHLLTIGDVLYLPTTQKSTNQDLINNYNLGNYDKQELYDTTMGRDFGLTLDISGSLSNSDCVLDFDNKKGYPDYQTVVGLDNLKQSIALRIFTRQGSLLLHKDYGSTFLDYIGKPVSVDTLELAKSELSRAVTTDSRVDSVTVDYTLLDSNSVCFDIVITPVSEDKRIKMYIAVMENGTVVLS